jgi:hypothetical protein
MNRPELEPLFRKLSLLLYDTRVPMDVLEAEVMPYVAQDVTFVDPWQTGSGRERYRLGLAGFHRMLRFRFEVTQVGVQLSAGGEGGRAMVDGVMHLEQLAPLLTYPLRTMLVYAFRLDAAGTPAIYFHEEMWSLGDMLAAVPGAGRLYETLFRKLFCRGFLLASRLTTGGSLQRPR